MENDSFIEKGGRKPPATALLERILGRNCERIKKSGIDQKNFRRKNPYPWKEEKRVIPH